MTAPITKSIRIILNKGFNWNLEYEFWFNLYSLNKCLGWFVF